MILKRSREIERMAEAAVINREALEAVEREIAPGVSTATLDAVAEDAIVSRGGTPAFKGYRGFPATLCTSINDVVVHGIPNDRPLRDGDIVSIDIGTFYRGFAADMARTYAVGTVPPDVRRLLDATERSLYAGIAEAQAGNRLGDVSAAIQAVIEQEGFWVVREFVGHGIGSRLHEDPQVPNFGQPGLELAVRECLQGRRVDQHNLWLVKRTNQILALCVVDAGFTTNGRVNLGQQCRWNLDEIHATQVAGRSESGDIADDTTAEGNYRRIAVRTRFHKPVDNRLHRWHGLVFFAVRQIHACDIAARKVRQQFFVVKRRNGIVARDQAVGAANKFGQVEATVEQPATDDYRVAALTKIYCDCVAHVP